VQKLDGANADGNQQRRFEQLEYRNQK